MARFLLLGGTGFVGHHLCEKLHRGGHQITVATRHPARAQAVQHLPRVTVQVSDIHQPGALPALLAGHDAVVNLVAILHGRESAFEHVHVQLPQALARACETTGVRRIVHVSALGAREDGPSMYQRSKARGEAVLRAADLDLTVLRPSVIFGAGDRFLNLFARMQRVLPLVPLAGAATRFQPVWVEDVADALAHALNHPDTVGQTVEAVGPDVLTLAELVRQAGRAAGCERPVLPLPRAVAYFQAVLMERAPGEPLLSTDNIASMEVDNVASPASAGIPRLEDWGLSPASLDAVLPAWLSPQGTQGPRSRLDGLRARR